MSDTQPQDNQALTASQDYQPVLDALRELGRTHLLAYSLACGELILQRFWGGDGGLFSSKDRTKDHSFATFANTCADLLADMGLNAEQLRRCVIAFLTWRTLPPVSRDQLQLSHIQELSRCPAPTQRAQLAQEAVAGAWTRQQLRDAVSAAKVGQYYDTDPEQPGTQPPAPPAEPERTPSVARWITRTERLVPVLQDWAGGATAVPTAALTDTQRQRLAAALVAVEREVAAVRAAAGLAGGA
jgi:hypothetical protein